MKKEIVQAAACFYVMLACVLVNALAAANGEAEWARIFFFLGAAASLKMGWHVGAAVDAAGRPRRPRRRSADELASIISNINRKD